MGRRAVVRGAALLVPALAGVTACGPQKAEHRSDSELHDRIHDVVTAELPKGPGVTVLAASGSGIVYSESFGFADRARGIRCGRGTVYDIASNTKQFTAAAVLKLESEGRVHVRDHLGDLLAGLPPHIRPLTVHQLLSHTSGLPEFLPDRYGDDYAPLSRAEMLQALNRTELRSRPGRAFHYSNLGYSLLTAVIEERSGLTYEQFLADRLFRPAGLEHTGYVRPRWARRDIAVEYDERGKPAGRPNDQPWAPDGPHWNLRGNGGMLSTATDLLRWHVALNGHEVLSADARRKMFTPHASATEDAEDGPAYGYGWALEPGTGEHRIAWHTGQSQVGGSYSEIVRSVDGRALVVMATNYSTRKGTWGIADLELARGIVDLVLED
ncbi:serine hydrolase domain-containing protein [Streptomyces flavofungini]|uniref:serine hydrolase domain-containing protein n=1 Tax=Streptomyces flavofungini TaxID=68200 RepID=UPI0025B21080|nr:serine hydrolase domain-containing protein [Streptomyces flavofungini]WJV50994.1 serine hydrolase domain-containing protein [Streptomyces flavofungini]